MRSAGSSWASSRRIAAAALRRHSRARSLSIAEGFIESSVRAGRSVGGLQEDQAVASGQLFVAGFPRPTFLFHARLHQRPVPSLDLLEGGAAADQKQVVAGAAQT